MIKACTHYYLFYLLPDSEGEIKIIIRNKYLAKNKKGNRDYVIFPRLTMLLYVNQLSYEGLPCTHFPDNLSEEDAATHLSPVQLAF